MSASQALSAAVTGEPSAFDSATSPACIASAISAALRDAAIAASSSRSHFDMRVHKLAQARQGSFYRLRAPTRPTGRLVDQGWIIVVVPAQVTVYCVFIASPGGLEKERRCFRDVLNKYNESEALERGVMFVPTGWETTPKGVGRPQEIINAGVRRCDYFVLVLCNRWGSPPGQSGSYSSGTEEEFHIARECHANRTMQDILVFFK